LHSPDAKPYSVVSLCIRSRPLATTSPTSLVLALDRQHNHVWKWHIHTVLIYWLTIGVFSISYCRDDRNHEPLISLFGPTRLLLLSVKETVMVRLYSIIVIKTSDLFLPHDSGRINYDYDCPPSRQHQHSSYSLSSTRHSLALSACNNPTCDDFNRHYSQRF
jgi:hypothetical protein